MAEASELQEKMTDLRWRIHTPNLLQEILNNPGTAALSRPLNILGQKLHELAEVAIEIDDPRLHLLMMDLTLYASGDPLETDLDEIQQTRQTLIKMIEDL